MQVRQETFWLGIRSESCKNQCWKSWLKFQVSPIYSVGLKRMQWESWRTETFPHVMFSAVFVGLKCLSGVELVFSHSSTFWESYPTKLTFCTCWSSGSWKVCQQANSSFPNGRVKTLHRIFLTFRHLSESQFKTQCFKKVPGYVEACWPLCKTWGAFAVTQPQDPLC